MYIYVGMQICIMYVITLVYVCLRLSLCACVYRKKTRKYFDNGWPHNRYIRLKITLSLLENLLSFHCKCASVCACVHVRMCGKTKGCVINTIICICKHYLKVRIGFHATSSFGAYKEASRQTNQDSNSNLTGGFIRDFLTWSSIVSEYNCFEQYIYIYIYSSFVYFD